MERRSVFMLSIYDGVREPRHDATTTCKAIRTSPTSVSRANIRPDAHARLERRSMQRVVVAKLRGCRPCQEVSEVFFARATKFGPDRVFARPVFSHRPFRAGPDLKRWRAAAAIGR